MPTVAIYPNGGEVMSASRGRSSKKEVHQLTNRLFNLKFWARDEYVKASERNKIKI